MEDRPILNYLKSFINNQRTTIGTALLVFILAGCAVSNEYGPYRGKVVDAETGKAIEGAVVFVRFDTLEYGSPGGPNSKYIDSVEVLTDENGEFAIPVHKIRTFKILHRWDPYETVIIFFPGYGVFPKHPKSLRDHPELEHMLPEETYVTIQLPKLKTIQERKKNLHKIFVPLSVPEKKQKLLLDQINNERKMLGLQPEGVPDGGL